MNGSFLMNGHNIFVADIVTVCFSDDNYIDIIALTKCIDVNYFNKERKDIDIHALSRTSRITFHF